MSGPMITVGADPEYFLRNKAGVHVAAFGKIGGDKRSPRKREIHGSPYLFHEDNAALEIGFPSGEQVWHELSRNLYWAMQDLKVNILPESGLLFTDDNRMQLQGPDLEHPLGRVIGCDPDYCAYRADLPYFRRPPFSPEDLGVYRYAGGHVHLGGYPTDDVPPHIAARFLDIWVGLPLVGYDEQPGRREKYGLAGLYRPTRYGVEYRTPSNYWASPTALETEAAAIIPIAVGSCGSFLTNVTAAREAYRRIPWDDVEKAINEEDGRLAVMLIERFNADPDLRNAGYQNIVARIRQGYLNLKMGDSKSKPKKKKLPRNELDMIIEDVAENEPRIINPPDPVGQRRRWDAAAFDAALDELNARAEREMMEDEADRAEELEDFFDDEDEFRDEE